MSGFTSIANENLVQAHDQLKLADQALAESKFHCQRANNDTWQSPAGQVFSRWLAELAANAQQSQLQLAAARAAAANTGG